MRTTETHMNPFAENEMAGGAAVGTSDSSLVADAVAGSRPALETLVNRHAPWIYNIAFRMVMTAQDAEDVTQETLIKVLTKLSSYDPEKGAFRTWLYRIVANHVINMRTRGYEAGITDLESYYGAILQVPDQEAESTPEMEIMAEDLGISCVMGTMLCLERRQRLAFILAVGFNATDAMGSEILDISRDSFRKTLSRARARLHQYMSGACSLFNPEAPCHCRRKLPGFLAAGARFADRAFYRDEQVPRLKQIVGERIAHFGEEVYDDFARLLRDHPFYSPCDVTGWLREMVDRGDLDRYFELDDREVDHGCEA